MLTINNKNFAINKSEYAHNECVGFYTVYTKTIYLYDATMKKVGFINKNKVLGSVNAGRHNYANPEIVGEFPSYAIQQAQVQDIVYNNLMV